MGRKPRPQQRTLSVRIPEDLRQYLEQAREVVSTSKGERVSTSDVAKMLMEMAKGDRLDDGLELIELLKHPTETLVGIRRKWEQKQLLSRAEWVALSEYIQVGCEGRGYHDVPPPAAETFVELLEAFQAVLALRSAKESKNDDYYLEKLGWPTPVPDQHRAEIVLAVVKARILELRQPEARSRPVFAGRAFYVALRHEELGDIAAINQALLPHMGALYRLAARGHWLQEKAPVRPIMIDADYGFRTSTCPQLTAGDFRLSILVTAPQDELTMALEILDRDVTYPLGPYPEIREFANMLDQVQASGKNWKGKEFFGYTNIIAGKVTNYYFRARSDGIAFGFKPKEWECLRGLFAQALATPELQPILTELALQYGEV